LEYLQVLQLCEVQLAQFDDPPLEVEGRISAAMALADRDEIGSAMDLLREALVLIKTMVELRGQGRRHDLLDLRIEAHLRRLMGDLVDLDQLGDQLSERARAISEQAVRASLGSDAFQEAVRAVLERRLSAHLRESAFARAVERLLALGLERHLGQDAFARAAASATARYPEELLGRPETISRIEAVAVERDRALVASSRLGDMVDTLVDRHAGELLSDPRLEERIELLSDRHLHAWLKTPEAKQVLGERPGRAPAGGQEEAIEASLARLLEGDAFLATVDERAREQLATPAFGAQLERQLRESPGVGRALEDRLRDSEPFADLLEQRSRKLLGRTEFTHRVDHMIRERCKALLESTGFQKAVDRRAEEVSAARLAELEQRVEDRLAAVAKEQRELEQRIDLQQRIDEQVTELVRKAVGREVRTLTAKIVPTMLKSALTGDEEIQGELRRLTEDAVKRGVDEEKVVRLVQKEVANREALKHAEMAGDGLVDQATAIARSEAIGAVIEEHLEAFKQREVARGRKRTSGAQSKPAAGRGEGSTPAAKKTGRAKKKASKKKKT
jgi:hypothetical protein